MKHAIRFIVLVLLLAVPALAQEPPVVLEDDRGSVRKTSVEDVFKGVSGESRTTAPAGSGAKVAVLAAVGGLVLLVVLAASRHRGESTGRPHHPGKLQRDLAKAAGLSRTDLRELRKVAAVKNVDDPMLLLLCPSLMQPKATAKPSPN